MDEPDEHVDRKEQLTPAQVRAYTEPEKLGRPNARSGRFEYRNGVIFSKSKLPILEMFDRDIIQQHHYDAGMSFIVLRDCANSKLLGRIYNNAGGEVSDMDAMTKFIAVQYQLHRKQWEMLDRLCFGRIVQEDIGVWSADGKLLKMGWVMLCRVSVVDAFDGLCEALKKDNIQKALDNRREAAKLSKAHTPPLPLKSPLQEYF